LASVLAGGHQDSGPWLQARSSAASLLGKRLGTIYHQRRMRDALYCASAAARESSRPLRNAFKQNKCRWIDAKSGACATGFPCLRPHLGTVLGIPLSFNPDGGPYSTKNTSTRTVQVPVGRRTRWNVACDESRPVAHQRLCVYVCVCELQVDLPLRGLGQAERESPACRLVC
jgi:hypothetical protein